MRSTNKLLCSSNLDGAACHLQCLSAKTEVWTAFVGLYLLPTEPTKTRECLNQGLR
jgi:hypothetical protein